MRTESVLLHSKSWWVVGSVGRAQGELGGRGCIALLLSNPFPTPEILHVAYLKTSSQKGRQRRALELISRR